MANKNSSIWWIVISLAIAAAIVLRFRPTSHVTLAEIYDSNLPTLMELGASWCPPCRAMKPVLKDLQDNYSGINVRYVDVEEDTSTARKYNVSAIPVIVFLDSAGNTLHTQVGYMSKSSILERWKEFGVSVAEIKK